MIVPYQSEGFPSSAIKGGNGQRALPVTWGELLWSAITVGRPGWYYLFKHGKTSIYEGIFRFSMVKMALKRSRLVLNRTNTVKNMDETEKGMVSYYLGMTFCKLFSSKLLGTPWLLHQDVWRTQLDIKLGGRSRPDLIGSNRTGQWHVFECKGRGRRPNQNVKNKAKQQARGIVSINGISCSLYVAAITYFVNDVIHFYWCDPPPREGGGGDQIELRLPDDIWQNYYGIVAEIIAPSEHEERTAPGGIIRERDEDGNRYARIEQCDLEVVIHRSIEDHLIAREWERTRLAAIEATEQLTEDGFHPDGLRVRAGHTWYQNGGEERSTPEQE